MDNLFSLFLLCTALANGLAQQTNQLSRPLLSISGEAQLGKNLSLTCFDPVGSTKPPGNTTYQWFKGDSPLPGEYDQQLIFNNVTYSDAGDYTCRYKQTGTEHLSPASNKFSITFKVPPQVYIKQAKEQEVYMLPEGRNLSLTCDLSNKPNPSVPSEAFSWTFLPSHAANESSTSGQEVNLTDPKQRWGDNTHSTGHELTVSFINRSHSGRYTCHATNDLDKKVGLPPSTASIEVQIQYIDDFVNVSAFPVVAGDKVTLTCQADSLPTANLTWLHQGRVLHTVESNEDVYSFNATGCQDSGEYQCRADNNVVSKSMYGGIHLSVECRPSPTDPVNTREPEVQKAVEPAEKAALDQNIWMTVCGVIVIVLLIICIILFVLQKRKARLKRRPRRSPEAGREARTQAQPPVARQHRRRRRRPRMDSAGNPHNRYHGNNRNRGGQTENRRRMARHPPQESGDDNTESSPFLPSPSDPVDPSTSRPIDPTPCDPVDNQPSVPAAPLEEEAPRPKAYPMSALAGIPMQIYPWAFLPKPQASDDSDKVEDKYGLPRDFRLQTSRQPTEPAADPLPEEPVAACKSPADQAFLEDEEERTYGIIDVIRGRRPRPSSQARRGGGSSLPRTKASGPPKSNHCTVPTLEEVMEENVNLDVVPNAPPL